MKILKYLLLAVGTLVVLVGAVLAYVAATFDPNAYKPQIIRLVQEHTQRTLKLDGDIKLAFWPGVGADLGRVSLSEQNSSQPFATVESARIALKPLPLLSRQLVVDDITIRGAWIHLVRRKDGRMNTDDLAGAPPVQAPGKAAESGQTPFAFDISRVVIADSAVNFRDETAGTQYALSKLNLSTGRIAQGVPSGMTLMLAIQADRPKLNLEVSLKTQLTFDLGRQLHALQNLALEVRGQAAEVRNLALKAGGSVTVNLQSGESGVETFVATATGQRDRESFDVKMEAPRLSFSNERAAGEKLTLNAKLSGPDGATGVHLNLAGIKGTRQAFQAGAMTLDIDSRQGDRTTRAKLASPLNGNLSTRQFSLPQLKISIDATGSGLPGKNLRGELTGTASVDLAKENAQLDLAGKIAGSALKARLGARNFSPPDINFDIGIDQLDVDRLLPPETAAVGSGDGVGNGAVIPASVVVAVPAQPEKPWDLSGLRALRASGNLRIGALKANNIRAANVRADLKAGNGRIDINPLAANLYQGTLTGAVNVNVAPSLPVFAVKTSLAGVNVAPLLKDLANSEMLEGRGTVTLDVTAQGNTTAALKRALGGSAALRITDGAVKGIDVAGAIRDARARLGTLKGEQTQQADARQKTDFSELTATFRIAGGVARNNDLSLKSPLLRVGGEGEIDIGTDTINYLVKASVVGTSKGQGGRDAADLRGITVPVRVAGPLAAPSYKLDFGAMLTDTARRGLEDAVKNRLQQRLQGGTQQPDAGTAPGGAKDGTKSGGNLRDALKGLLGR